MPEHETEHSLSEERRKEIFLALVDAQDHEMSVTQSRKAMVERFGISRRQLLEIEQEGLEKEWPPL